MLSERRLAGVLATVLLVTLAARSEGETGGSLLAVGAPPTLHDSGLYVSHGSLVVDPAHLGFAPQYPLWTDGAAKRRWLSLPPGERIDASDPDAWNFPVGTRFWKEFAFDGRPIETRYMERRGDGSWLFAAYAWSADGTTANLVSDKGILRAFEFDDGTAHAVPSQADCGACHMSGRSPVLGFSTLQLSDDRDPNALHADVSPHPDVTLAFLIEHDLISGLDRHLVLAPPRASTASASQRTALGYLHANCGHCHNPYGPLNRLGLFLRQPADSNRSAALSTTFRVPLVRPPSDIQPGTKYRIAPGNPRLSAIPQRMAARGTALQMPPIGTVQADAEAVELINRWIAETRIPRTSVQLNVSN